MREETADVSKVAIILTAAKKRFEHFGLTKTTMNEIAADISMSKASLYYYFPDKEHLFIAVMDGEMAEFVRAVEILIRRPLKAATRLKHYAALRTDYFRKFINLGKLEVISVASLMNPAHAAFKTKFYAAEKELIGKILHSGIAEGEFHRIAVDDQADLFVTTLTGLRLMIISNKSYSLSAEDNQRLDHHNALFLDLFIKALSKS